MAVYTSSGRGGIAVTGLKSTIFKMKKYGVQVEDLKNAFRKIGDKMESEGRRNAPRETGTLAGTVRRSDKQNAVWIRVGNERQPGRAGAVEYAPFVMFGSVHNPNPNPWLYRQAARWEPWIRDTLRREMDALIYKIF